MQILHRSHICRVHHKGTGHIFSAYAAFGILTYPCICIKCNIGGEKKACWFCHFWWNQNGKATTDAFKTAFIFHSCPVSEVIQISPTFWFNCLQIKADISPITPFTLVSFCFPSFRVQKLQDILQIMYCNSRFSSTYLQQYFTTWLHSSLKTASCCTI